MMRVATFIPAIVAAAVAGAVWAQSFKVGDKVEAFNVTWSPATIVEIGTGNYAGYYKVHYDGFSQEQYLKADSVRAPRMAAAAAANAAGEAAGPRPGKYACMGYNGVNFGQFRWYMTIDGRTYRQTIPDLAAGAYAYNAATKVLTFSSGPYAANNWMGKFSVEREGKTHKIVLRDKAKEAQGPRVGEYSNIYCNNSTDS